jgi:PKD repeat protein
MRKNRIIINILISSIFLFSITNNTVIGVENISIQPIDDSYIDFSNQNANYGDENYLKILSQNIEYSPPGSEPINSGMISYLKFDLSSISDMNNVVKTVLEIYILDNPDNSGGLNIYFCSDDTWNENQITWKNAPFYDNSILDFVNGIEVDGQWYSFDVTDAVMSEGLGYITFVLVGFDNSVNISFFSKDNIYDDEIYKPKLTFYYNFNDLGGDPIANFDFSPLNPFVDDVVQFFDKSVDYDGDIISWFWDFGDGSNSNEQNPTHNYSNSGTYNVSLFIEDDEGFNSKVSRKISVSFLDNNGSDGDTNIDDNIDSNTVDGKNDGDGINSDNQNEKLFGIFSPIELLIGVLISVIIINSIIFIIILIRKK